MLQASVHVLPKSTFRGLWLRCRVCGDEEGERGGRVEEGRLERGRHSKEDGEWYWGGGFERVDWEGDSGDGEWCGGGKPWWWVRGRGGEMKG